jgi:hypothetical protein
LLRNALYIVFTLLVALILGFGTSYYMVENGREMSAQRFGVWYGWADAGGADTDPYSKAVSARSGALQLGRAEGVVFTATQDQSGAFLSGSCSYLISGSTPSASVWTLRAAPMAENAENTDVEYLTSLQINRNAGGTFTITVSPNAAHGNWLPTPDSGKLKFILSFYDTNAFLVSGHELAVLPTVQKVNCS